MGFLQNAALSSLRAGRRNVFPFSPLLGRLLGSSPFLRSATPWSRCIEDLRGSSLITKDFSHVIRESSFHTKGSCKVIKESLSSKTHPFDVRCACAFNTKYSSGPRMETASSMKNLRGKGNVGFLSHADSLSKSLFSAQGQIIIGLNPRISNPAIRKTDFRCSSINPEVPVVERGKGNEEEILVSLESASTEKGKTKEEARPKESLNVQEESSVRKEEALSGREELNARKKEEGIILERSSAGHLARPGLGQKPRVVVLGTGWAASRLMKDLDTTLCDIVCVSPRNHMVFTPLLASTCVGTLEFRSVAEPVVRIQSALSRSPHSYFFLGHCNNVDVHNHEVHCMTEKEGLSPPMKTKSFTIAYDKLVIASGAQALTFNIHGVSDHAIFLREVSDAQAIRKKLLLNLMLSDIPGTTEEEKRRLLHCVVVGGGPTGVEFSGELSDFIRRDVRQRYAHVQDYIHVTLIEAKEILSSFDLRLRLYAIKHLTKAGVRLVKGVVKDVEPGKLVLSDGSEVPYGLLVWSTGVGPSGFVKSLELPKSPDGRIGVDERLKIPGIEDVFAIGDCAGYVESVGKPVLPALAQVAERQGKYLGKELNRILKLGGGPAGKMGMVPEGLPFAYKHMGSMASVGSYKALVDLRKGKESRGFSWAGFISWLVWRSAYLTRVVSWRNRFYVAVNWATTFVFGRDISRL